MGPQALAGRGTRRRELDGNGQNVEAPSSVNHPGTPPLAGSFGFLDAYGTAEASFALPAGTALTLAGLTLNHAYAVLDATTLQLEAVSQAVPVTLLP